MYILDIVLELEKHGKSQYVHSKAVDPYVLDRLRTKGLFVYQIKDVFCRDITVIKPISLPYVEPDESIVVETIVEPTVQTCSADMNKANPSPDTLEQKMIEPVAKFEVEKIETRIEVPTSIRHTGTGWVKPPQPVALLPAPKPVTRPNNALHSQKVAHPSHTSGNRQGSNQGNRQGSNQRNRQGSNQGNRSMIKEDKMKKRA